MKNNDHNRSRNLPPLLLAGRRWLALLCTAAALNSPPAHSQQQDTPEDSANQWYQVEVFIFADDNPDAGDGESWPDDIELQYPQRIVQLIDGSTEVANPDTLAQAPDTATATGDTDTTPNAQPAAVSTTAAAPITTDDGEQAFVALPEDHLQLNTIAARILRQRDFRLLFHKAWRQPVFSRDQSNSILIRGGDRYDDHYELEGSVTLSVERYLHFTTDLWLSTFVSTAGLDETPWPKLPKLPITSFSEATLSDDHPFGTPGVEDFGAPSSLFDFRKPQYAVDRTVVMRQSRRMRSGELHYLDHPLMGLLVKVVPYEPQPSQNDSGAESDTQSATAPADTGTTPNKQPLPQGD